MCFGILRASRSKIREILIITACQPTLPALDLDTKDTTALYRPLKAHSHTYTLIQKYTHIQPFSHTYTHTHFLSQEAAWPSGYRGALLSLVGRFRREFKSGAWPCDLKSG